MYQIDWSEEAIKDAVRLRKSDAAAYRKLKKLLAELQEHPYTGTGKPEVLKGCSGIWSRRIDKKNRLRYMVNETTVIVFVVSASGHYDDK